MKNFILGSVALITVQAIQFALPANSQSFQKFGYSIVVDERNNEFIALGMSSAESGLISAMQLCKTKSKYQGCRNLLSGYARYVGFSNETEDGLFTIGAAGGAANSFSPREVIAKSNQQCNQYTSDGNQCHIRRLIDQQLEVEYRFFDGFQQVLKRPIIKPYKKK